MHPDPDLQHLMARYQQGDSSAATALVRHLSPQLHRTFLAQFASRGHADDLLQETWLRVHQVRHTYRPGAAVLPWLYAIARNVRVDHFRKTHGARSREQPLDQGYDIPEVAPPPPDRRPDLNALLAALPEGQREVIAMLKLSDMSLEEVARATSSSVGSVKQKAHRAYSKLRQMMAGSRTS